MENINTGEITHIPANQSLKVAMQDESVDDIEDDDDDLDEDDDDDDVDYEGTVENVDEDQSLLDEEDEEDNLTHGPESGNVSLSDAVPSTSKAAPVPTTDVQDQATATDYRCGVSSLSLYAIRFYIQLSLTYLDISVPKYIFCSLFIHKITTSVKHKVIIDHKKICLKNAKHLTLPIL